MAPLEALVAAGHDVRMVITQPDRKRGRGSALVPSPVKAAADAHGIQVAHQVDRVLEADVELGVVVAFGRLVKAHVLDAVPMVNLHFSLLPRWRGAAPVERAILAGDAETGVCLMALDPGLDTGGVYACETLPIAGDDTADALRARLVDVGTRLLVERLAAGLGEPVAQVGEPTYAAKLEPADFELDFDRPAVEVHRVVRVGRAWTTFRGSRLHVVEARPVDDGAGAIDSAPPPGSLDGVVVACGSGTKLALVTVKAEGRQAQSAAAWRNGARPTPAERLGR